MKFKSFEDAFTADKTAPVAANDNKPIKHRRYRHRGTLPALKWLFENMPDLAEAFAAAIPKPKTAWSTEARDTKQEIRPTVGELMKAANDARGEVVIAPKLKDNIERISMGALKFQDGRLVEWNVTKKGHRLRPRDRIIAGGVDKPASRSPNRYLNTKATTKSPMEANHLHRPMSGEPAIAPAYDPLPRQEPNSEDRHGRYGVEEARAILREFGVDSSVGFERLPFVATKGPTVVAHGARFLGGISRPTGNSSEGAVMWDFPEKPKGEIATILEEVAARGTLKSIGIRLGYSEGYADRAGKAALIEAAKTLRAMNDNKKAQTDVPDRVAV